jgi:hypothetical protein
MLKTTLIEPQSFISKCLDKKDLEIFITWILLLNIKSYNHFQFV